MFLLGISINDEIADYALSGEFGDNLHWEFDITTGILTISGTGEMPDYVLGTFGPQDLPWRRFIYRITKVIIEDGVTSIGDYSFAMLSKLKSVEIGTSVGLIGHCAFMGCDRLSTVSTLPKGLVYVGKAAFYNTALTELYFSGNTPNTVWETSAGDDASFACLEDTDKITLYYPLKYKNSWDPDDDGKWKGYNVKPYGEDPIAIYVENRDVWWDTTLYFYVDYSLFDLEGDGIPELIASEYNQGSTSYCNNHYYKIDIDTRSVYEMQDLPSGLESIDIFRYLKIYMDNQTGRLLYYYNDTWNNGWEGGTSDFGLFYEQDGVVYKRPLWYLKLERDRYTNVETYTYCIYTNNGDMLEVSESNWNQYQEEYLAQYTLIADDVPSYTYFAATMNKVNDDDLRNILSDLYNELYPLKPDV